MVYCSAEVKFYTFTAKPRPGHMSLPMVSRKSITYCYIGSDRTRNELMEYGTRLDSVHRQSLDTVEDAPSPPSLGLQLLQTDHNTPQMTGTTCRRRSSMPLSMPMPMIQHQRRAFLNLELNTPAPPTRARTPLVLPFPRPMPLSLPSPVHRSPTPSPPPVRRHCWLARASTVVPVEYSSYPE